MLEVMSAAALAAVGTEDEPIVFTGWQESPGSWGGILFHSTALTNEISHAIVEYAGSPDGASGNISLSSDGGGRIKLTSTTLRYGAKFGLTVLDGASFTEFSDNTIGDNEGGAIRAAAAAVHSLPARATRSQATVATIQAGVNAFGEAKPNSSLFGQSVARATWKVVIPAGSVAPANSDLDLASLDDIVLKVTHHALPRRDQSLPVSIACLGTVGAGG